ncbi:surfeit locus 1 family protein [Paracidovorax avenae]|uniref:SURF1 family protein n=1 Tax=Paracidovorax avenae TaxID=80867 RepID=UPI000D15864E|nr:surfeit locus 1 family protein [Paracidovorax avenae]AVT18595.1 surfeit locus 1 family protein [Paracidovorax avenae]
MAQGNTEAGTRRRSPLLKAMLILVGIALFLGFLGLGTWQVQRRAWKLALIERVDQRVHAAPVPVPPPAQWPQVDAPGYEYLPVAATGRWLSDKTVLAQATTDLGSGFWVMTPLQQADGTQVLVNRGFVPQDQRARWLPGGEALAAADAGGAQASVQGLLRMSEPSGSLLRANDPAAQRWYSRDVAAIAADRQLLRAAPFFIDAGLPAQRPPQAIGEGAAASAGPWPRAGMTVIRFPNSHLVYAITWYGLALMVVGAGWYVARYEFRPRAADRAHHPSDRSTH